MGGEKSNDANGDTREDLSLAREQNGSKSDELTVCDVIGEWGLYQWSLTLFGIVYSALAGLTVVVGPMLTPDIGHLCDNSSGPIVLNDLNTTNEPQPIDPLFIGTLLEQARAHKVASVNWSHYEVSPHECTALRDGQTIKCNRFIYDDGDYGEMLTNHFDLVCDRVWLRSLVSSASLIGMLISSITLGVFSDKYGRLRCIKFGFVISVLANLAAILAHDYYLFCASILLMSYAQVGAANALNTLLMEAVSPRARFMPTLEYGVGWALGVALVPLVNYFTKDYRLFMVVLLVWQLLMGPWLHWGVFESIRWLLSEGHINRAQIELRRACRMNGIRTDAKLAQDIAQMHAQQVRKASRVIESELAPDKTDLEFVREAIRRSFNANEQPQAAKESAPASHQMEPNGSRLLETRATSICAGLSPTLARKSFSVGIGGQPLPLVVVEDVTVGEEGRRDSQTGGARRVSLAPPSCELARNDEYPVNRRQSSASDTDSATNCFGAQRNSYASQGLIRLAMKYSIAVQQAEEGKFFLVKMFHRKLWRQTVILTLVSVMYESSYYGFVQTNRVVGTRVEWNYLWGALSEGSASLLACAMLALVSRRFSLVSTSLIGALCLFSMAATYHFLPAHRGQPAGQSNETVIDLGQALNLAPDQLDSEVILSDSLSLNGLNVTNETIIVAAPLPELMLPSLQEGSTVEELFQLRQTINMLLMLVGKFVITVGIQIGALIAMECYPNNLRQTAPGTLLFVGRGCSIVVPFLFNDHTESRTVLKLTLVSLGSIGLLVCCLVPWALPDNKDKELCDRMNEIED